MLPASDIIAAPPKKLVAYATFVLIILPYKRYVNAFGRINAALTPNLLKVTKNPTSLVGNYTKRRIPTSPQGNA